MALIEEKGQVVSLQGGYANILPVSLSSCDGCESKSGCGTSLLKPLFSSNKQLLVAKNTVDAKPGDQVVIGLERMAIVLSSLIIYLFPLLMLLIGAAAGKSIALMADLEKAEIVSIFTGVTSAVIAFYIGRVLLRSAYFRAMCQPVVLRLDFPL